MKKAFLTLFVVGLLCGLLGCVASQSTADKGSLAVATSPAENQATNATLAPEKPAASPKDPTPGEGKSIADAFYRAMKPRIGENLDYNKGHEVLLARAIDTDHKYPRWRMSNVIIDHNFQTEERTWAYTFADKSRITFHTMPAGDREGLKLTRVEITRS